jgi:hypothetical protein
MLLTILQALIQIPSMVATVDKWVSEVLTWWLSRQKAQALASIADAAASAARAETQEERYASLEKWRVALSKPRVR